MLQIDNVFAKSGTDTAENGPAAAAAAAAAISLDFVEGFRASI